MKGAAAGAVRAVAMRWWPAVAVGAVLGIFACAAAPVEPQKESPVADVAAKVAQVAAAVTGQKSPMADDYEQGRHVGFDTHTYPGTATMTAWKKTPGSPYKWVGFYLPSP